MYDVAVSADEAGMVEYWSGIKHDLQFPKNVDFEFKTDTDLFEFIMVIIVLYFINQIVIIEFIIMVINSILIMLILVLLYFYGAC